MPDISVGTLLLLETAVSGMSLVGYVTNTAYKIKTLRTEILTIQLVCIPYERAHILTFAIKQKL